ncbi:MAG TPA: DUF5615 family PIN-like protein [Tepidisphaeraceae bacterium]|nr:DUF5615 family PIN-like protein [Tepidisphaeraceae bacterium]
MSVGLFMDEHIPSLITKALRASGADVITVQEDGIARAPDPQVLDRAGVLGRVVTTNDHDFLVEAARRQKVGEHFAGVIFVELNKIGVRACVDDLELICFAGEPSDFANRVRYLPL